MRPRTAFLLCVLSFLLGVVVTAAAWQQNASTHPHNFNPYADHR